MEELKPKLLENGLYQCPYCVKQRKKMGIGYHIWKMHGDGKNKILKRKVKTQNWNKGLTKETDKRVKKGADKLKGRVVKGHKQSEETKKKISNSLKIAHSEGRAWNIGKSRWNNKKSYAELFFQQFLTNIGLIEKNDYYCEFPFSKYSIDFYFHKIKLAIEIDGIQHEKDEYKKRDLLKENLLKEKGIIVLRISYKFLFENTKEKLKIIENIIKNKDEIEIKVEEYSKNQLIFFNKYNDFLILKNELKLKEKTKIIEERKEKIVNIDFSKFGWVAKVGKLLNLSHTHVRRYVSKNYPDLYKKAFKKKTVKK